MPLFGQAFNQQKQEQVRANSQLKQKRNVDSGTYYNDSYAIEQFIRTEANDDPFLSMNDPTYYGFKLFFHFDAISGLLADESNLNSALAYLNRIGQTKRYELLGRFINVLSRVNSEASWIFQSLDGLEDVYNTPFHEVEVDKTVTINTLETLDTKIMSLMQMYRQIAYDYDRMVEVLPANLRRFSMSIYLYDFRNFDNLKQDNVDFLQTVKNQDIRQLNHTLFDFGYCEFQTTSGSVPISQASNVESTPLTNNIAIRFRKFAVSSLFKSITGDKELKAEATTLVQAGATNETPDLRPARGIDRIRQNVNDDISALLDDETWKTKARDIVTDAGRTLVDRVRARLTSLYLGNIHGFSLDDLLRVATNPSARGAFNDTYSRLTGTRSLGNDTKVVTYTELANVFENER